MCFAWPSKGLLGPVTQVSSRLDVLIGERRYSGNQSEGKRDAEATTGTRDAVPFGSVDTRITR
jgi:hypothetical protein